MAGQAKIQSRFRIGVCCCLLAVVFALSCVHYRGFSLRQPWVAFVAPGSECNSDNLGLIRLEFDQVYSKISDTLGVPVDSNGTHWVLAFYFTPGPGQQDLFKLSVENVSIELYDGQEKRELTHLQQTASKYVDREVLGVGPISLPHKYREMFVMKYTLCIENAKTGQTEVLRDRVVKWVPWERTEIWWGD
jgi:hypothetical protein